jgi:predicted O-methyltransferase YrrM
MNSIYQSCRERDVPCISKEMVRWVYMLVRAIRPKHVVELGMAEAYSTLWIAHALRDIPAARLDTVDISEPSYHRGIANIAGSGYGHIIHPNYGNANEWTKSFGSEAVDMVFVDARKKHTALFAREAWRITRQ